MNIGIYGGSFNPIHSGHIALARHIRQETALDEVWLLVSPQNPLKQHDGLLDDRQRLLLAQRAVAQEEGLVASDYEFHLPRPSYTWNTLQRLSADFPMHDFHLVIGADNWTLFGRWFHHDDIVAHYPVVIYPREGHPIDPATLPAGVSLVNTPLYNISSTQIRRCVAEGQSVAGLVPDAILPDVQRLYGCNASETPSAT